MKNLSSNYQINVAIAIKDYKEQILYHAPQDRTP